MATLTEALAAEAEALMWYRARTDNSAFDLSRSDVSGTDDDEGAYDASAERAHGAYLDWRRAIVTVADTLAGEYGDAAAALLYHLVQPYWAREHGCAPHSVPEAVVLTQAVFSPQSAYDRLPDDGDDAHGLPHE